MAQDLRIRDYRDDLRICPSIVCPSRVNTRVERLDRVGDVREREIAGNFRRDRFHGLPEMFESLETPKQQKRRAPLGRRGRKGGPAKPFRPENKG